MERWAATESGKPILLVPAADIRARLDMKSCIQAVAESFRLMAEGAVPKPAVLGIEAAGGGFHVKAGVAGDYFVAKVNGNYPGNADRGEPTIQGLLLLADARDGRPLAVLDSAELTAIRTGAATGVAVRALTTDRPLLVTIIGAGRQARAQLEAVIAVRRVRRIYVCDADPVRSRRLAETLNSIVEIEPIPSSRLREFTIASDLIITCTTARQPILDVTDVNETVTIAAVGADNPHKQELAPGLMKRARIITDITAQCAAIGDLHHAIASGQVAETDVSAELGEIVTGRQAGRSIHDRIIVFDSTGFALQDLLAARLVYETLNA